MSEPKRVLQVVTVMDQGGAETMVMNHYRVVDRTKVQFDFLVCREERGHYDDEVEALGGRIFRAMPIRPWQYGKFWRWLDAFFKEHAEEFVAVHSHIQENSGFVFKYAQKYGIRTCIAHSHIAFRGIDAKIPFRKFARYFQLKYSTYNLSCGEDAGHYLYGNRQFELFNNAIDARKFVADEEVRSRVRQELGIADRFVLGSVARITWQKNHTFMLDVLAELKERCPEALLVLVGSGDKEPEIRQKIERLGLSKHVMMLGNRANIYELLQAFDLFFMPSLFEGLPVSVIEAQAAGLPCVLSDTIDRTTDVSGLVRFVSLDAGMDAWCETLLSVREMEHPKTTELIAKAGYDVHQNVKRLMELYGVEKLSPDSGVDMEHRPMVTVGLPVYNAADSILPAIRSVLSQTFSDFELIITDDGSTDDSLSKIKLIDDPRIRIIVGKENKGIAYRINEQIESARGTYFARMDADDLMLPDRLKKQVEVMEKHREIDVLGASIVVMDESYQILGSRSSLADNENLGIATYLLHPTVMARTEWFKLHHYNPAYSGWEDYELWLRTRRFSNLSALSEPLLIYRDSSKFNVRKFIRRRMIGCKVILNEWMLFDNPLSALRVLCSNLFSCIIVPVVHVLRLDEWRTRKRNTMLTEDEKKQYESLMNGYS